jgi:hypothetical protein
MSNRAETPIDLAFLDDAVFAEGAPANFKSVIPTCQVSPLVKYVEQTTARGHFRHRRVSDIGNTPSYLPIGMFSSPYDWIAREGQPHSFAGKATKLLGVLERCPRLKLLIDYSWEAGLYKNFLQDFDEFVADIKVDPRRVVLLISNRGLEARYHTHLANQNRSLTDSWQIIGADLFLMYSGAELRQRRAFGSPGTVISTVEAEYNAQNRRPHKFLSLNRRPRWHRFMLAMALTRLNMQRQGLSSMPSPAFEGDWRSEHHMLEKFGRQMDPVVWQQLKEVEQPTLASLPWTIDVNVDKSGQCSDYVFQNPNREGFLRSYVQIVTETCMEGLPGELCLTEKTCKALANLQPFICFGMARVNARLAELGFEPVNIVDGAYDDELDIGPRLTRLYHALQQLEGMSIEDIHDAYYSALPRISHNQQRLFDIPEVLVKEVASRLRAMQPD